ncbi:MAG TPA: acyl-CoA thioesterase [Acidobacteriota bacterium]|nr:acyl-CoA thioesterase [Acidobacteriota bacterium]HRV07537.1 acyl-CoA thioesterase [Acidobacteriota bacterium]
MTQLALPNDANTHGSVLGGRVMHLMDLTAAIAASRHCRRPVVTVSVDSVRFHYPVHVGEVMLIEAVVTRAFRTSLEIQVAVESENLRTGLRQRTTSAFLTFVALNDSGEPTAVPPLEPETEEEKRRFEAALERRARRLAAREE